MSGGRSILLVEDVPEMLELLKAAVEGMSEFHVSGTARNVAEARLAVMRNRPTLVLLDEVLPGESSLDLLESLLGDGIPVFLITSLSNRTAPLPPGALGRLTKPTWKNLDFDRRSLEAVLLDALPAKK